MKRLDLILWLLCIPGVLHGTGTNGTCPDSIIEHDIRKFARLLDSPVPGRRVEGILGLSHLKHWPAEGKLIVLLQDPALEVQREALLALCRLGGIQAVPHLIELLEVPSWEFRQNAWLGLQQMTGQTFPAGEKQPWRDWWHAWSQTNPLEVALAQTRSAKALASPREPAFGGMERRAVLRTLRHLARASSEPHLIELLEKQQSPPLDGDERKFICEALERIGTAKAIPALAKQRTDAAAWALGAIGGSEAEQALLQFPKRLPVLLALDRLGSTNAGSFIPHLVANMGLITYRGQPDDVMNEELQPIQRAGANLIRRSGLAPLLIERVLHELERSMNPPMRSAPPPECPPEWIPMLEKMRDELKPGFVRGDGATTSQPLAALCYLAEDSNLADRLVPLLRHPAFVARVYVGLTLGYLRAESALPALLEVIEEGYPFSDAVEMASGKHFDKSQTVRWRGFLCMALGRMGGESARQALERLAADPDQARDIRYSSVVGLGFIASPQSLPVLERIAREDLIWMIRDEAAQAAAKIKVLESEARMIAELNPGHRARKDY